VTPRDRCLPQLRISSVELFVKSPATALHARAHRTPTALELQLHVPLDENSKPVNGQLQLSTPPPTTQRQNRPPRPAPRHTLRATPSTRKPADDVPSAYVNHNVTVTLSAGGHRGSGVDQDLLHHRRLGAHNSSRLQRHKQAVLSSDGQKITYSPRTTPATLSIPHFATAHIQTEQHGSDDHDSVDANWHASP